MIYCSEFCTSMKGVSTKRMPLMLGILFCLTFPAFAQEGVITVEENPNLRQATRINDTINALNSNVPPPPANSNSTIAANSTITGNLTTTNTPTTNGTAINSSSSSYSSTIVVPPDNRNVSTTIPLNGTLPGQNSSLSSSNATAGTNLTSTSNTTINGQNNVNGTLSSSNTTITTITTNSTTSNFTTTIGNAGNETNFNTTTSNATIAVPSNTTNLSANVNGTSLNVTTVNGTSNAVTSSASNTSGITTINGTNITSASSSTAQNGTNSTLTGGISPVSVNATSNSSAVSVSVNNATLPVLTALAANNRSADGTASIPAVFILGATTTASSLAVTVPPALAAPSASVQSSSAATATPPMITSTTASSVLVSPAIHNNLNDGSTRPSIVVNIDIDLGPPRLEPTSTTPTTPATQPTTLFTTSASALTSSPSQTTANSVFSTQYPNASNISVITPVANNFLSTAQPIAVPPTSILAFKPALEELLANKNGTQVICFSLPFDLLEKLLPLITSLGISPNSVTTTPSSVASSPLYNPLTSAPTPRATEYVPGVSTITPNTSPSGNYPFLGPFGAGSYGGFRPTAPPPQVTYASSTTLRPMNPYPVMPPQQVMQPAGVIPYYTYAPGTGSSYANMQPAAGTYAGSSISMPAYPLSSDKQGTVVGGGYGGVMAQPPAQAVISTSVDGGQPSVGNPKDSTNLQPKALASETGVSSANQQQTEQNLPAWCANKNLVPDAITVTADGLTHVFIGNQVLSVKNGTNGEKKVVQNSIQKIWRGLPTDITRVNAATTRPDGTTYLFSGPSYWKFDSGYRIARDSPRKTSIGFPGVTQMDAVYQDLMSDGDMSFLQGPGYFTYNHKKFPPYQGPASLSDLGLPNGTSNVNAAFTDLATKDLIFVVGPTMYRVSAVGNFSSRTYKVLPGYPKPFRALFGCSNL